MINNIIRSAKTLYSSQPKLRTWVKRASNSRAYYYLTRARIKNQIKKDLRSPINLVIETSSICNARCIMCPHPTMKRTKSVMTKEVFEKIVARVKEEKLPLNKVFFSGLGEPLADSDIIVRIKAFKDIKAKVRLYTNASLLTPKISQQLADLKVDEINISFNGATAEHYSKVMGLDFDRTKENIDNLLNIRKETTKVFISSILVEENQQDIKEHLKNWSTKVDSVTVSLAHQWGGGMKIGSGFESSAKTYPCRSLWHTLMIDSEGNFVICCRDYESGVILGNIMENSFEQIRKSLVLEQFRSSHLEFSKEKLPLMCRQCNFPYQDGIEWYLPRSID